ncbi:hypothetical protein BJY04DRAFT_229782 [Aspergillus karnatakaensis]|uniref:uncharacterized protein n=1 Tax=Aspergillus karnatakaensis TaxID=1810916 RepID=UPI003CCE17F5
MDGTYYLSRRLILLALFFTTSWAHSWVEQLMIIAPNGSFIDSPGYPRGNVLRSNPSFNDVAMSYLVSTDGYLCKESQRKQVQTDGSPRLQASAGAAIALRFQENGHVTIPLTPPGKPDNRGTIYVYGTTDPKEDEKFQEIHKVWNEDGSGGDGRGVLLAKRNYDDGRCYQKNSEQISQRRQKEFPHEIDQYMGEDLWCQADIALPSNVPTGKPYTLYWVWDWPTLPGIDPGTPQGKEEVYSTCMDVDVVNSSDGRISQAANYDYDQSLNRAAIPEQFNDIYGSRAADSASGTPTPTPTSTSTPSSSAALSSSDSVTESPSGTLTTPTKATVTVTSYRTLWDIVHETASP